MKRITKIAGLASIVAATGVMWSVPASALSCGSSACAQVHDRWPGRPTSNIVPRATTPTSAVPEPGILPLLAVGLGGVGFLALRRKRANAKI
ncbi:MAG: PEP-CTERM sorting domain-containing protein [Proteobacteria bacterium]|nr:PEP-CTERM sorting domain-containing protein [Pseudomonadota bacterium]